MQRLIAIVFFVLSQLAQAQQLKLPRIFNDHMVLQRDQPVKVWGWGPAGQVIMIRIDDTEVTTKTNENGHWSCIIPEHEKGGPFEMVILGSGEKRITDIWYGDVWVAGGQSNMEWKLKMEVDDWEKEVEDSDYPQIRFFDVPNEIAFSPREELNGGQWVLANPENSPDFSAVAWFFAKMNHLEKDVPVGIIESNWGGTPAEAWTSSDRLLELEAYREQTREILDPAINWTDLLQENRQNGETRSRIINSTDYLNSGVQNQEFDDSAWQTILLPGEETYEDVVWIRKYFSWKGSKKEAVLSLGRLTINQDIFINGQKIQKIASGQVIPIPKGMLKRKDNLIVVRLVNGWNNQVNIGAGRELWIDDGDIKIDLSGEWKYANTIEEPIPEYIRYSHYPATLFNAMINPIIGYSIRGAIWYQGESNAGRHEDYQELFSTMIQDLRARWGVGDFPFLYVQLANFMQRLEGPSDPDWARLREAQTQTLSLDNTGMAVTIDIGNDVDIHPRNKQDVGHRLWLAADKIAFDHDLVFSGPLYESHTVNGSEVEVNFKYVGSGIMAAGPKITGFEIAGKDQVFHWADGRIQGTNQLILTSDAVPKPLHVRYAWANNPACNLYNKEGLPAVPFRSDSWPQK